MLSDQLQLQCPTAEGFRHWIQAVYERQANKFDLALIMINKKIEGVASLRVRQYESFVAKQRGQKEEGLSVTSVMDLMRFYLLGKGYHLYAWCGQGLQYQHGWGGPLRHTHPLLLCAWQDNAVVHDIFLTLHRHCHCLQLHPAQSCKQQSQPDPHVPQKNQRSGLKRAKALVAEATPHPSLTNTCMLVFRGSTGAQDHRKCVICAAKEREKAKQMPDYKIKDMKTPMYCSKCNVSLCLVPDRNCFLSTMAWDFKNEPAAGKPSIPPRIARWK